MADLLNLVPWWVFSLIFALLWPIHNEANRHFKVDGSALLATKAFFTLLFVLPFTFFVPWPTHPAFYACVIISGFLFGYQEAESFKLAKNYGGLFLSLQSVIWMATAITLWWLIDPTYFFVILHNPISGSLVIAGLALGIAAQFFLRSTALPDYKSALNKTLIIAVMGGCGVTSLKYGMENTDNILSAFVWTFLLNIVLCLSGFSRLFFENKKETVRLVFNRQAIKAGIILGLVVAVAGPVVTFAFALTPNPGFSSIVTQSSVLWLYLFCRFTGHPTNVKTPGLTMTVLGAIILITGTEILRH